MGEDAPPAWTRYASTTFTASRGGLAPSTLALLNYNGLDSRATTAHKGVAIQAAAGHATVGNPARKICGGTAHKVLVSHNGAMSNKVSHTARPSKRPQIPS